VHFPADTIGLQYQVINHGYDRRDAEQFLNDVSGAAAQVLGDMFKTRIRERRVT
jgi:hypothetical protein